MNSLTKEAKAEAIKLAMRIDLGEIDTKVVLEYIRKNTKVWTPVLEFWEELSPLTRTVLDRLVLENRFLKS